MYRAPGNLLVRVVARQGRGVMIVEHRQLNDPWSSSLPSWPLVAERAPSWHSERVKSFLIRDAEPPDMDVLKDVFRRSALSNEGDRANLLANPDALEFASDAVNDGRTRVAVVDDRIVGFATTVAAGDALELDDLFVDPDWMKRGVGRVLVLDVAAIAHRRGVRRVDVTANEHALAFYAKAGFLLDHDVETRFGSAARMHLEVGP
jgi:GNAT superfamily N-acetyltransferase